MESSKTYPLPDIGELMRALGMGEPDADWIKAWPISQTAFPQNPLAFLNDDYILQSCQWLRMAPGPTEAYLRAAKAIRTDPVLQRMVWHFHYSWFLAPEDYPQTGFPLPKPALGEPAALLYGIANLSGLPRIRKLHRQRGVPESITVDTLSDLERWTLKHRQRNGAWGFSEVRWLRLHFSGRIYKLGRLQFEMARFFPDYHVLRHRQTRQVVVFAGQGMRFSESGQFAAPDDPTAWEAAYEISPQAIRGCPISPFGHAENRQVSLPAADWSVAFSQTDPALNIHIPEAGPMDHAACGESFRAATEFFPRHHADFPYKAFMCFSWLLDPQFERYLDPRSNIVRFLQEYYLFPLSAFGPIQSFANIFDNHTGPLSEAPQRTSLQRATRKHLEEGGVWRVGGGVILPEDLHWGQQVYRHHHRTPGNVT